MFIIIKLTIQLCDHASQKNPLNSLIARCSKCLSPPFMAECAESFEVMFGKLLTKIIYKTISCTIADDAKGQYREFLKRLRKTSLNFLNSTNETKDLTPSLEISCWELQNTKACVKFSNYIDSFPGIVKIVSFL